MEKIYCFYHIHDISTKNNTIYCREFDVKTGLFKKAKALLTTSSKISEYFRITHSADHSKIGIVYRCKPKVKNDTKNKELYGFASFNSKSMKLLWKREEQMKHTEDKLELYYSPILKNSNFFYISASLEKEYVHLKIPSRGNVTIEKPITNDTQKLITNISFYYTKWELEGVLYEQKSAQGKIKKSVKSPFKITTLNELISPKKAKKEPLNRQLVIKKIEELEDGSRLIIARNETNIPPNIFEEDFVVIKLDNKGKLIWNKRLPFDSQKEGGYYSFRNISLARNGNDYYLFFLDDKKNIERPINDPKKAKDLYSKGYLGMFKVDIKTGDVEKKYLFDIQNIDGVKVKDFYMSEITFL